MRRIVISILALVTVVILFFVLCTYRVRPYESVILDRFGKPIDPDNQIRLAYGWYLCLPTDRVVRLDKRLHLHSTGLFQLATAGNQTISVQAFAAWDIVDPKLFYERLGGNDGLAENMLLTKMLGNTPKVLGSHSLSEFFQQEQQADQTQPAPPKVSESATLTVEDEITRKVNDEMKPMGIEVKKVGLSRLAFPPLVAQTVYDRMSAERMRLASKYDAEAAATALKIRAEGKATADTIVANARGDAAKIRAEGDTQALTIMQGVSKDPKQQQFLEFWRELELLKASISSRTILVIRTDRPISEQVFPDIHKLENATQPGQ